MMWVLLTMSNFYFPKSHVEREREAMQARIDTLNAQVTAIKKNWEEDVKALEVQLQKVNKSAFYYDRMQKHILENETIGDAWMEFMAIYMLALPDTSEVGPVDSFEVEQKSVGGRIGSALNSSVMAGGCKGYGK